MANPVMRLDLRNNSLHDPRLVLVRTNINAFAVDAVANPAWQERNNEGIDLLALNELDGRIKDVNRYIVALAGVINTSDVVQHRKAGALLRLLEVLWWQPHGNARILRIRTGHRHANHLPIGVWVGLTDRDVLHLRTPNWNQIMNRCLGLSLAQEVIPGGEKSIVMVDVEKDPCNQ